MSQGRVYPFMAIKENTNMAWGSVPVKMVVPLVGDLTRDLKILTWNVTGVPSLQFSNLKDCVDQLNIDIIVMQGISSNQMFNDIRTFLGIKVSMDLRRSQDDQLNVGIRKGLDSQPVAIRRSLGISHSANNSLSGLIDYSATKGLFPKQFIFYRSASLILEREKLFDTENRTLSASFLLMRLNKKIHIHNVWTDPVVSSDGIKAYYLELLSQKNEDETAIVVGELGVNVAPLNKDHRNLATNMMLACHIKSQYVPKFSVGGFCSRNLEKILQLHTSVIDIESAADVIDQRKIPAEEKAAWDAPQEVLSLDFRYAESDDFMIGKTIVVFEQELRKKFNDDKIFVSPAATPFNEKYVLIRFSMNEYTETVELLLSLMGSKAQLNKMQSAKCKYGGLYVEYFDYRLIEAVDIICKIKKAISGLDNDTFDAVVKSANDLYVKNTHAISWVVSLGLYSFWRDFRVKSRVDAVSIKSQSPQEEVLALLTNPDTGNDLNSFKYFLISSLADVTVKLDAQAKALIDYAVSELRCHIKQEKKPNKIEEEPPVVRRLTKSISSDTQ